MEIYSLYEINNLIHTVLSKSFNKTYLVTAEINQMGFSPTGHAYLDLMEKDAISGHIKAQIRATIWANVYRTLNAYFQQVTGRNLEKGLKILVEATVQFHEIYGLSLSICGIKPEYTVGEIEIQRQKTIEKLQKQGLYDKNKRHKLPMLIKNIAIISSENAAGYGDFINQLTFNIQGFKFNTVLFNSPVQGAEAEKKLPLQLDKIAKYSHLFDCVAIIRGGGSKGDLACFDDYNVCEAICNFPLPIITGIGHDRDVSIADEVACVHLKTPTAVAQFIVDRADQCKSLIDNQVENIKNSIKNVLQRAEQRKNETIFRIITSLKNFVPTKKHNVETLTLKISNNLQNIITNNLHKVENIELKTELKNPITILKKGYSYTMQNGKVVNSIKDIKKGEKLSIIYYDGTATAEIKAIEK